METAVHICEVIVPKGTNRRDMREKFNYKNI